MAAPRKPLSDKLMEVDAKILKHQEQINALKAKRQLIIDADKKAKVEKLVEVMAKNNISVDELLEKAKN